MHLRSVVLLLLAMADGCCWVGRRGDRPVWTGIARIIGGPHMPEREQFRAKSMCRTDKMLYGKPRRRVTARVDARESAIIGAAPRL